MKYAIHQRSFQYNDEYYRLENGRKLHAIFGDKIQAFQAWIALERESLQYTRFSEREPMHLYWIAQGKYDEHGTQIWSQLFAQLKAYGIDVGFNPDGSPPDDWQLHLDTLTDEQLADVLLQTNCNEYILQSYTEHDKKYVLYFNHEDNDIFSGYLRADSENYLQGIMETDTPEALLEAQAFSWVSIYQPLITRLSEMDKTNPLVQTILQQYPDSFILERSYICFIDSSNQQALQAMNAVLEQPFYVIRAVSPEALLDLQTLQNQQDSLRNNQKNRIAEPPQEASSNIFSTIKNWFK